MIIFKIVKYFPIIDTSQTVMNVILCYLFLFYDANHIGSDRIVSYLVIVYHMLLNHTILYHIT